MCIRDSLSHSVVKIKGEKRIEGVTVVQVDEKMRPIPGTEAVSYTHLDVYKRPGFPWSLSADREH